MKYFGHLLCAIILSIISCKEESPAITKYPKVNLYAVKESKSYLFENNQIIDSVIFKLSFDQQERLISQWSLKENLVLELDYSTVGKVKMLQKSKSTDSVNFVFEYLLNSQGYAQKRNTYGINGILLQSNSYLYNSEGQKIREYIKSSADSSLIFSGIWDGPNLVHFEYPTNEHIVSVKYTQIADLRNLGFYPFTKDRSYYLIQEENVKSRGVNSLYQYNYIFDSLKRPVEVIVNRDGEKYLEKHYQYWE